MLKGEVAVILYDKNGNEVDRREAHNLVTNATKELLNIVAGASGGSTGSTQAMNSIMPLGENALGGLLLFENALDEDATKYYIPSGNMIIASADRTANSDNPYRGSLNTNTSGRITNGFKSTWDFSTSQANGTISAIALTSVLCGGNIANSSSLVLKKPTSFTDGTNTYTYSNLLPLKYDKTTQYFYFAYPNGTTTVGGQAKAKFAIYKVRIPFYKFGVADSANEVGLVEHTEYNDIVTNTTTHNNANYSVDLANGFAYIQNTYTSASGLLLYTKVDLSDFTATNDSISITSGASGWCVSGGYLYYCKAGMVGRKALTTGLQEDKTVNNDNIVAAHKPISQGNGLCYLLYSASTGTTYNSYVVFDDADMTIKNFGVAKIKNIIHSPVYLGMFSGEVTSQSATEFKTIHDYLGTVFNLQTAINKTDATTMKVVYTLTDVTE